MRVEPRVIVVAEIVLAVGLAVPLSALAAELPGERTVFGAVGVGQSDAGQAPVTGLAGAWHQPYVPGGGYWRRRFAVDVANPGPAAVADEPVVLSVGGQPGQLPLAGTEVRELRVCAADGVEFRFGVQDPRGATMRRGRVEDGFRVAIPAECEPGTRRRYYVYTGNPRAWDVPEFFDVCTEVRNTGFEAGSGATPEPWVFRGGDELHVMVWERAGAHSGERCVSMAAPAGAAATWFTVTQTGIRVAPGGRYVVRGWVKGRDVTGRAGLYLHVADGANPQAVNRVEGAGEGSFDWREVGIEFTAPPGATTAALGSVLYGSGQAWYDDLTLTRLDAPAAGSPLRVSVAAEERLVLATAGTAAPWPAGEPAPNRRVPLYVRNLTDRPFTGVALAELPRLIGRPVAGEATAVGVGAVDGTWLPCVNLASAVAFRVSVPARTEYVCNAYCLAGDGAAQGTAADYHGLLDRAWGNLLRNPDMEDGDGLPTAWSTGVETAKGEGLAQSSPDDPQVTYEWPSPGRFGKRCLRLTVGAGARKTWRGWRQEVTVAPDTTYLYAGWVRTEGITDGEVRLHCHTLDDAGRLCGARYCSVATATRQGLKGTHDWTLLLGTVRTSSDTRSARIYLTMDAKGTVVHDGVLFTRVAEAVPDEAELNPATLPDALRVWQVNPIVKVFRDDAAGPPLTELVAAAARSEKESVQLALLASRDLTAVKVTVRPPVHATGQRLDDITVGRVGYVPVDHVSAFFSVDALGARRVLPAGHPVSDGWAGWWPDPLLPVRAPLTMAAGRVQPVWLTFSVPGQAPAGEYHGELLIEYDGGRVQVPVRFRVWDFGLPAEPRLTALFDLREGPGWSFLTPESRRAWLRFMADRRLCADQILPSPVIRRENGQVTLEPTEFDRAAAWVFGELHMRTAYLPLEFYAFGWGHDTRRFRGCAPGSAEYRDAYSQCLGALWEHVKAKGWADRFVLYVSDEPHFDDRDPAVAARVLAQMKSQCALIHAAVPGVKVYSSTWRHTPEWDSDLDIWGAGAFGCFPVETMDRLRAAGRAIWFTTDAQLLLDTPYSAIERLNPYYCFAYGAEGYEFWALGWWTFESYDPFRFGWYAYIPHTFTTGGPTTMIRYPNGSGHLAYPGWLVGESGPLSSVRLEQVREGMEDFEYMAALRDRVAAARQRGIDVTAAAGVLARVRELVPIPNAGGTHSTAILPDPDAVYRLRADLAAQIERLGP